MRSAATESLPAPQRASPTRRIDGADDSDERCIRSSRAKRVEEQIRLAHILVGDDPAAPLVPIKNELPIFALLDDHAVRDRDRSLTRPGNPVALNRNPSRAGQAVHR